MVAIAPKHRAVITVRKHCLGKLLDCETLKKLADFRKHLEAEEVRRIISLHRAMRRSRLNNSRATL